MTVETILLLLLVLMQAVIFIMLWRLLQTRRQQGQELGAAGEQSAGKLGTTFL